MLLTGMALLLGLIPILWSTGTGVGVMKRIACAHVRLYYLCPFMVLVTFPAVLVTFPAVFVLWQGRRISRHGDSQ